MYQTPVIYAAPSYYVPMQSSGGQEAPLISIIDALLRRFDPGFPQQQQQQQIDSSIKQDIQQLKADVAQLGLRIENANSILQTQGKKLVELEAELSEDGSIGKLLREIRANTARNPNSTGGAGGDGGLENPESIGPGNAQAAPGGGARRSARAVDDR